MLGLWVQTGNFNKAFQTSATPVFTETIIILLTIYYAVAVIVCFCAYREFKAMVFDAGMGQGFGMGAMPMMNGARPGADGGQAQPRA